MTANTLRLRTSHRQAMVGHAGRHWPEEACGLLAGPPGTVERVYPVANVAAERATEYYMDPAEQVRVMLEIEAAGWEVCGIFHSHPAGPAWPSATDLARAYYPDAVYVILAPARAGLARPSEWRLAGFWLADGQAREVALAISE